MFGEFQKIQMEMLQMVGEVKEVILEDDSGPGDESIFSPEEEELEERQNDYKEDAEISMKDNSKNMGEVLDIHGLGSVAVKMEINQ